MSLRWGGRLRFLGIALFWCVMNVLLWRSEFGGLRTGATPVSPEVVLDRVLTAPDPSTLEVRHQGKGVGYLHWYPDPGEESSSGPRLASDYIPDGMVRVARGYQLRLEGQLQAENLGLRLRFQTAWTLDTNRAWRTLALQVVSPPLQLDLSADVDTRTVTWTYRNGEALTRQQWSFDDLQDPRALLAGSGGPLASLLAGPSGAVAPLAGPAEALHWDAWTEWMPLGNSRVRVYRLQATLLDRYTVVLLINRAGEILRAELPNGMRAVNEGLGGF